MRQEIASFTVKQLDLKVNLTNDPRHCLTPTSLLLSSLLMPRRRVIFTVVVRVVVYWTFFIFLAWFQCCRAFMLIALIFVLISFILGVRTIVQIPPVKNKNARPHTVSLGLPALLMFVSGSYIILFKIFYTRFF